MSNHSSALLHGTVLITSRYGKLCAPSKPHIAANEGGHLFAILDRQARSRLDLSPGELLDLDFLSIVGAKCLSSCYSSDWFNFQENGNWSLNQPEHIVHLHVYGRRRDSQDQPFGEALLFPKSDKLETWRRIPFTKDEIELMTTTCSLIKKQSWATDYLSLINSQ